MSERPQTYREAIEQGDGAGLVGTDGSGNDVEFLQPLPEEMQEHDKLTDEIQGD